MYGEAKYVEFNSILLKSGVHKLLINCQKDF